jgi:hypothetical protein
MAGMGIVGVETAESVWREVAGMSDDQARAEMQRLAKRQKDMLIFVTAMTNRLSRDAQELAIYALVVIYRMFSLASGGTLRRVRRQEIMAMFHRNESELAALAGNNDRFLKSHVEALPQVEPHVMSYVVDVLVGDEPERDVRLTDNETGELFVYLKTAVDCFHVAVLAA